MNADVAAVISYSKTVLPLASANLSDGYFYQSLPLCVIDAVFSIGVRYEGVENAVRRYCEHYQQRIFRYPRGTLPQVADQESISGFCTKFKEIGFESMATSVLCNTQRTSAKSGILKAEAVIKFATALRAHGVEYFQDVGNALNNPDFDKDVLAIPGQGSGISLKYFFMLAGSEDLIKPDRMIEAYLYGILGRSVDSAEAQELLFEASTQIQNDHPHITARLLDHEIWKYQRNQDAVSVTGKKKIKDDQARLLMAEHYFTHKATLPTNIRDYREVIIELIMEGLPVDEAFSQATAA